MEDAIETLLSLLESPDPALAAQGWELCAALPSPQRRAVAAALTDRHRWTAAVRCLRPDDTDAARQHTLRRFAVRCVTRILPLWVVAFPDQPAVPRLLAVAGRCADGAAGEKDLAMAERDAREVERHRHPGHPLPATARLTLTAALACARYPLDERAARVACDHVRQALREEALAHGQDPVAADQRAHQQQRSIFFALLCPRDGYPCGTDGFGGG